MKRTTKRGFTIVELVIVIAVIAILAAVLIPTFSNLVAKANLSSDKQAVREMNMALAADESLNGKPANIEQAMKVLANAGYNSENWVCLTTGYEVYWYEEDNRLVLYNTSTAEVEYPEEYTSFTMISADNHFWLYNENNEKAVNMEFTLGSSSSGSSYTTISGGKGSKISDVLASGSTGSGDNKIDLSSSSKTALTDVSGLLGSGDKANDSLKSSLGIDGNVYIYGTREVFASSKSSSTTYASMQVYSVGATETPVLKSDGKNVKENLVYIGVTLASDATEAEKAAAYKEAGELVYTAFTKINANQLSNDTGIVLQSGVTIDASGREWAPVKELTGYFGSSDAENPAIIDGAEMTSATGFASTVNFTGSGSKYFVTGFIGTVYGNTTIENVTFRNISFNKPAMDYQLTTADRDNGKVNSRNCIGIIGGITEKAQGATMPANVVIRNITVEDSVSFTAGATAGGLVGFIGAATSVDGNESERYLHGNISIENCTVSAKLTSDYTQGSTMYGAMGGVIGLICRSDAHVTVKNVTFNGSVDGHYHIGGIVGEYNSNEGYLTFAGTIDASSAQLNGSRYADSQKVAYLGTLCNQAMNKKATYNDNGVRTDKTIRGDFNFPFQKEEGTIYKFPEGGTAYVNFENGSVYETTYTGQTTTKAD